MTVPDREAVIALEQAMADSPDDPLMQRRHMAGSKMVEPDAPPAVEK